MLKSILSISGKPGLYRLVSQGKNMIVVESLIDGKRTPAYARDKIISLGDIAIYTTGDEVPLSEVFEVISKKYEGKKLEITSKAKPEELVSFFTDILPEYDKDRVYNTDIKKVISWYNCLISAGITSFKKEEENKDNKAVEEVEPKVKEKAAAKPKAAPKTKVKTETKKKVATPVVSKKAK